MFFKKPKPTTAEGGDRRKHPRIYVPEGKWPIIIRSFAGNRIQPKLVNLSQGGLTFTADRKNGELNYDDDRLTVEFIMERHKQSLTVQARLAWLYKHPRNASYQGGIKFGRQPAEIQRAINGYLDKLVKAGGTTTKPAAEVKTNAELTMERIAEAKEARAAKEANA